MLAARDVHRARSRDPKRRARATRANTTDPEVPVLHFADGAFAPGYNVQLAAMGNPDGGPVAIVGVTVTTQGNDKNQMLPMRAQVETNLGMPVRRVLVDCDFVTFDELCAADEAGYEVVAPVPKPWANATTSKKVAVIEAWKVRMGTAAAKAQQRGRKALVERMNARIRAAGLGQVPVRGTAQVTTFLAVVCVTITMLEFGPRWLGWPKMLPSGVPSIEAPRLRAAVDTPPSSPPEG